MLKKITRGKLIQLWFALVAVAIAGGVVLGVTVTMSTAILLAAASLVPPGILLFLWPGADAPTAADVLHAGDR